MEQCITLSTSREVGQARGARVRYGARGGDVSDGKRDVIVGGRASVLLLNKSWREGITMSRGSVMSRR